MMRARDEKNKERKRRKRENMATHIIYEKIKKGTITVYKHKNYRFKKHSGCRFCDIVHRQKNRILFENDHLIVVFGRLHHKGHLVVLTRTHEEHLMLMHKHTIDAYFNDTV